MKIKHTLAALSVAALTMAGTGFAADGQEDEWQFGVTVPLWAAGIDGNATLRGMQRDVSISFDELRDHLDASFALGLEARKDKFGLYAGVGYMKFSGDTTAAAGGRADAGLKFLILDAGGSYRLVKTEGKNPFILEAIAGIRYWYAGTDLKVKDAAGVVLLNSSDNKDLVDPIIGLRGSKFLTPKWHLDFQGDFGGFDISYDTDITWSATGVVTYDLKKWVSLSAGYKALGLNVSDGSGANKNGIDITMNGVLIAAKFKF